MTARSRTLDLRTIIRGSVTLHSYVPPLVLEKTASDGEYVTCVDTIDERDQDNNLNIRRQDHTYGLLSGQKYVNGVLNKTLISVPISYSPTPVPENAWPADNLPNLAIEVLARSSPSEPRVSIPTFIGEMRDLPGLVRSWGRGLIRRMANANLWWRFGLAPLLADLRKLLNFQRAFLQRLRWLKKLRSGGVLHRRVKLEESRREDSPIRRLVHTDQAWVYAMEFPIHTKSVWGTTRWYLAPGCSLPELDEELINLARRLVMGVNGWGAMETAWELLPWSWLIDWFIPIGQWLAAMNNSLPLEHDPICIMRRCTTVYNYSNYDTPWDPWVGVAEPHRVEVTLKRRDVVSGVLLPMPTIPGITPGQWSILGSLLTLKGPKLF